MATPSCKGFWRECLIGHVAALNEVGILVVRKKGSVGIVWQLALSATVVWNPERGAGENELMAPPAEQRSV